MNKQDKREYERLKRFYDQGREKIPVEKQKEVLSKLRQDITDAFDKQDSESLGTLLEKCGNYAGKYPEIEKDIDKLVHYFNRKGVYGQLGMIRYQVGKIAESCIRPENIAFADYMDRKISHLSSKDLLRRMTV